MFHSARIKLTAWYLLIIMLISLIFSGLIYEVISSELDRFTVMQRVRVERQIAGDQYVPDDVQSQIPVRMLIDPELIKEARRRLILSLLIVDASILVLAGGVGYFLAGRTLRPIQNMVREQNRFIADASHELRTPLTALKSSIEVHLRDKQLKVSEAKLLLKNNLEEVNQLQSLSDALLQLAQYQQPTENSTFEILNISDIVQKAIQKVEPIAKQKQITFMAQLHDRRIKGESAALTELLVILLENAIKYSPKDSTVHITITTPDSVALVAIQDEGTGISKSDLPHIFDRFYRADKSRSKERTNGYGLGLAIAKQIVTRHHGTVEVSKTSKTGTTFTVKLPSLRQRLASSRNQ